jgi:hypothetical protein
MVQKLVGGGKLFLQHSIGEFLFLAHKKNYLETKTILGESTPPPRSLFAVTLDHEIVVTPTAEYIFGKIFFTYLLPAA